MVHGPCLTVSKSQFKPRAFEYFRLVQEQRETIVNHRTRHSGAQDRPRSMRRTTRTWRLLRGTLVKYEEPLEPVGEAWEAAE